MTFTLNNIQYTYNVEEAERLGFSSFVFYVEFPSTHEKMEFVVFCKSHSDFQALLDLFESTWFIPGMGFILDEVK